ncbi:Rho1 guanine nucleotide exchange factor 3 [Pseudocercospora fuligena]|uniref:Rho1 guanine nucleotide exchange factor 3 n=1 Tax=Pseudocercospora fuligena TaxID=685502 RepID=A0A8H6RBM2_9PEZI|nr:Rho1 guanine nucleotide exchange factor 3 [Pseudocercospora fuligena]
MSYHQGGGYGQQPPQQPPYQYQDPNQQYQYQQPGANGTNHSQYGQQAVPQQQTQYAYAEQTTYGQYQGGGPVQQPTNQYAYREDYHSPRSTSFGQSYGQSPQYGQYNPQTYSQPAQPPPQQQSYNPAAYASFSQHSPNLQQGQYSQSYNPGTYLDTQLHSTSGPVDPYAYAPSPGAYSGSGHSPSQNQSPFTQPPSATTYSPNTQPPYSPQPYAYSQSPPPPPPQHSTYASYGSGYQTQASAGAPPPLPPRSDSQSIPYPTGLPYRPHSGSVSAHAQPPIPTSMPGSRVDDNWLPSPPTYGSYEGRPSVSPQYPADARPSPPSSTPGPTPPAHGISRTNTLGRPLPPDPPGFESDYFQNHPPSRTATGFSSQANNYQAQDDLFDEVENAVMNAGRASAAGRSPSISISQAPFQPPSHSTSLSSRQDSRASRNGTVNGHLSLVVPQHVAHEAQYSSDSDMEAAQGLAMMRRDEEDDRRRQSGPTQSRFNGLGSPQANRHQNEASDSDDYGGVDMSSFGGGYDVQMTYGGDPSQLAAGGELNQESHSQTVSSQHSSMRRSHASQSSRGEFDYRSDSLRYPLFNPAARVEVGGTGGLSEPTADGRRQSYDEGDEYSFMEGQLPDRFPDEPPDIFFNQASTSYPPRPLPAVPYPENDTLPSLVTEAKALPPLPGQAPYAPDAYPGASQSQYVPRSTSLVSHSTTPQVVQPLRSKTDAEERRRREQQMRSSMYSTAETTPASASMIVDLPTIGAKRFNASKLGANEFKKCEEPWALTSLLKWLLQVTTPEQTTELKEADVKEALVSLFTSKVPTMNIADAEGLSDRVVQDLHDANVLITTEEWVKLVPGPISGVIFQLTQSGCYSPTVHEHLTPTMRCYSHHCQRTLKKVNLATAPVRTTESWSEFYKLKKEDLEGRDRKEVEKQNVLHEIVQTEETYMSHLEVLRVLYRDQLMRIEPSIVTPKRKDKFIRDVFGRVDNLKMANEEHLLPQLKYRQHEQGPWITGFSDIFRQWIRKAKTAYVDYATEFPRADHLVRTEMERNIEFRNFAERCRNDKRSNRLSLDSFLKAPISRLQRYTLLLSTVLRTMREESQEKVNLQIALDEVRAVALECDARVADMQRKIDLADLSTKLVLRPGMQKEVELNLDHFGRQLIHRGDLQRMGSSRFNWLDCHALLFDHYLILAKTVAQQVGDTKSKIDRYDVSRLPIPMDLLVLESANDPPVQKSSYVKGIASVRDVTGRTGTPNDPAALGRVGTNTSPAPGGLQHTNTAQSMSSLHTVTSINEKDSDRILYPFRVKHLGRDDYTLFAPTEQARGDWCQKILEAKTKHAKALFAQNAEPFKMRVMADSAFVYDAFGGNGRGVTIKGTPLDRAINEVEHKFKDTGRPGPICRARVNCATSFTTPLGAQLVAVGTDYGVYVSELDNPRGWNKTINMSRVTQVAVLEEFNLFLLISDRSLIAYHLDVILPNERNGPTPANDSARKAPQKLSGSRDVGFFCTGKMKDRTLVFYKKRENLNSVFKVLEPVYQKSSEKKRGMFKRGTTEFFREYDEFYIPAECTGMNLFHSSLAVSTARGFEVLTLDKKQPWSVPDLNAEHVQNIAQHIKDQRALRMLRLSDQEFLLCYANCAVYINKHGDVSRSVIMRFVGNAQNAALFGPYLVLFDNDFVEIRNAQNGRLKQIIAGREVKCLDDGTNWSANAPAAANPVPGVNGTAAATTPNRTLKLVMQHPEMEKTQIVVELLLNEKVQEREETSRTHASS